MPRGVPKKKEAEQSSVEPVKKTPGTVTVGCKLPNGLHIDYQGKRVTLNGSHSNSIIGGHGLTQGVDRDWFNAWLKDYAEFAPVKKGLIFAHEDRPSVEAEAREKEGEKTGLEGINPEDKTDPRMQGVETAEQE
ncbi:MAG TPA: hypothetical protein VKA32_07100 [Gammaproteobacteria bacterium]|nr:hypothetical protein [Gammaproteobacteria bacterium]